MAYSAMARLSSHSTDREYSSSRENTEDDGDGDSDDACCCSESIADLDEEFNTPAAAHQFCLDVFSQEFTGSRIYRAIVRCNLPAFFHAVYCLREPVTVIDENFGVNFVHLTVTTADTATEAGFAPFIYALSNFRVDVSREDAGGDTPLRLALRRGLPELTRALLRCGAAQDSTGDAKAMEATAAAADATREVYEQFWPGLWSAVESADYFLVDRLLSFWCRVRVSRLGESLISFARRVEAGSLIIDLLESSRPTLEFVHATLAGDARKMQELLGNKNVNSETRDRGFRPALGAPCEPRSLRAAAEAMRHFHVLHLLPHAKLLRKQQPALQNPHNHHQQLLQQQQLQQLQLQLPGEKAAVSALTAAAAAASPSAAAVVVATAQHPPLHQIGRAASTVCRLM